jgi:hypothetical protein
MTGILGDKGINVVPSVGQLWNDHVDKSIDWVNNVGQWWNNYYDKLKVLA